MSMKEDLVVAGILIFLIVLPIFAGFSVYNFLHPGNDFWQRTVAFIISVIIAIIVGLGELIVIALVAN